MTLHRCKLTEGAATADPTADPVFIRCNEDEEGKLWWVHCMRMTQVDFCPFCGYEAKWKIGQKPPKPKPKPKPETDFKVGDIVEGVGWALSSRHIGRFLGYTAAGHGKIENPGGVWHVLAETMKLHTPKPQPKAPQPATRNTEFWVQSVELPNLGSSSTTSPSSIFLAAAARAGKMLLDHEIQHRVKIALANYGK